jgi:uncharacterized membrane protein
LKMKLMDETEITRQLTTFAELVKHLSTKEELQKLRVEMILWMLGIGVTGIGILIGVMVFLITQLDNKFTLMLQHWKP